MELKEMITKRTTTRSYTPKPIDSAVVEKINGFIPQLKPLYPEIKTRFEIVEAKNVRCILPWSSPQYLAAFSEDTENSYENTGFMLQQLDLYLQSLGLGVCWLGMGKFNPTVEDSSKNTDSLKYIIMLAFGTPNNFSLRSSISEFNRKALADISDIPDNRLEPARLAPSSVNSQPWYFTHDGDVIHAYRVRQNIFKQAALGKLNRIDMGIALSHMYIANADTFAFFKANNPKKIKGCSYTGSFTI